MIETGYPTTYPEGAPSANEAPLPSGLGENGLLSMTLEHSPLIGRPEIRVLGVDLAWGEKNPDGVCAISLSSSGGSVLDCRLVRGDVELLQWVKMWEGDGSALIAIDAPIVCPNTSGARPVDGLTHRHFGKFYAGCHPANSLRCPRPPRICRALAKNGFAVGWKGSRVVAEVYPHPAMVRLFGLDQRIPYKRGPVVERRRMFGILQSHLHKFLLQHFPFLAEDREVQRLLQEPWTKAVEDQTDALFCSLIGVWHRLHDGRKTQVLGDTETGFLLVPYL